MTAANEATITTIKTTAAAIQIGERTHHQLHPITFVNLRTKKIMVSNVTPEMLDVFMAYFI